jgi:hypothetical protein
MYIIILRKELSMGVILGSLYWGIRDGNCPISVQPVTIEEPLGEFP